MDSTQYRNHLIIKQNYNLFHEFRQSKILLLSPNLADYIFWKSLLPTARFTISTIQEWNIENVFEDSKLWRFLKPRKNIDENKLFDLTIAQNVFMYIKKPLVTINHIAKISDNLFIQDLKYRKRSKLSPYFGGDGDKSRYSTKNSGNLNQSPYNLADNFSKNVMKFQLEFIGERNGFHTKLDPPIHILALIKINSRTSYSEFREIYSKFSVLRLRIIDTLKQAKIRFLYIKSIIT